MCKSVGVDPLSSNKGFWVDILGVGDFYYELAVSQIKAYIFLDLNCKYLYCPKKEKWRFSRRK
jgi:ESCRT-II complex subunit VPS22